MFAVVTRSKNDMLTERAQMLLNPIARSKTTIKKYHKSKNQCTAQYFSELAFLNDLFKMKGWVIHLDEDAYCFNIGYILQIREFMEENDIHICGCPDDNVRLNGNPLTVNPFFLIINMDKIKKTGVEELPEECEIYKLESIGENINKCDSHYSFFWFLQNNGVNFYHFDREYVDLGYRQNPCILKDMKGNPFLIHAWEARWYYREGIKRKVDYCYDYARNRWCHVFY